MSSTSALILSAPARHRLARLSSPRSSARSAPRAAATQHITLDAVKCFGSPRTSQIPWSGSRQCSRAASTNPASPSHTGATIWPAPRRNWTSSASRIMPHTSCCCWFQAPLPTRTGRAPRYPDRWSRVRSVRSRSPPMPYMICSSSGRFRSPPLTASRMKPEVLDRLPVKTEPVQRAEHERRVPDPGEPVVPVARPAGCLRQRGRRRRHDRAGGGVAERLQRERAAVQVGLPWMVRNLGRAQPVAPEIDGGVQGAEGLVLATGNVAFSPGQDHEGRLALGEGLAAVTAGAQHAQPDVAHQFEPQVSLVRGHGHGLVPLAVVIPDAAGSAIVEQRGAVHHHLDPAADTGRDPDQRARQRRRRSGPGGSPPAAPRPRSGRRPESPARSSTRSGSARSSPAPSSPAGTAAAAAPGRCWDRTGSYRRPGPRVPRTRWENRGVAGTATRRRHSARPGSSARN